MKFLRLRIANYRGITSSEVKFSAVGITLVQGPNEVGKTSLGEAIGLLFEFPDDSKHSNVKAIRPVHRDEGPEIELQAESGPYAFTYFKRFHKKPGTKLTVARPKPENYTGREAHERAEAILRETLDIDLWKALTIQQGDAIQQPILTKQTSLSMALDKAAGGHPADPREEGLFEKVREEYALYFTENGAERKELKEARKLQEDNQAKVAEIEQQIRDLEQDIERAAILQRKLGQLKRREDELTTDVVAHVSSLEEIGTLESALAAVRLKLESEQKSVQVARRDKEARQGLIEAVARATKTQGDHQESFSASLPALNQAEEDFKKALAALNKADKKRKEADALAALRRADFDYYNNRLHLDQLRERKERIDQARSDAAQAEEALARNKMNARTLQAIQEAEKDLLTAKAKLEMGAPHVLLHALAECRVMIDDVDTALDQGDDCSLPVADSLRLTLPRKLDIEINAGSSSERLQKKVDDTQLALDNACYDAGVAGPDEARRAYEERGEALRQVKNREQIEKDNLRDLTYEQLDRKVFSLKQSVPDYLAKRVRKPAISPDLDSAKRERSSAETGQQSANGNWETARKALDAARGVRDEWSVKHQEARVQLDLLAKDLKRASENLDRARQSVPDEALEATLTSAIRAVGSEENAVRTAESSLKARNPDRVKSLAETAKGSLKTTQNRRGAVQTELTETQTRLKIHGEEGLHERSHAAQTNLERIETKNLSWFRRAVSSKTLFETMREERDKARRAYVAPLKEKIEHLSRLVFDESFQVDIDEDLKIAARTLKGITVPFDFLSGGTKEQLSLIFRLACSMIVAKDGGTPLILDDALGYTDPDRLHLMGAVLAKAAKECQIIIFTCVPDRYCNVGEATVVAIG